MGKKNENDIEEVDDNESIQLSASKADKFLRKKPWTDD